MKRIKFLENYLKVLSNIYKKVKSHAENKYADWHHYCMTHNVYNKVGEELISILLSGFVVWIAMFAFPINNPFWLIPSYGVIPWFALLFQREWQQNKK